jgi:GNAT superfamily N-acetyltransferase
MHRIAHGPDLAQAVVENLTAFHVFLSEWPEISLHRDGDCIWTISRRRFSLCNVILEAQFDPTGVDARIERALAPYQGQGVNLMWKLGPSTRPADIGDRLAKHGFLVLPTLHGMALDLGAFAAAPVRAREWEIREVRGSETLKLWRRAVDRGFGWPSYGAEDLADNLDHFVKKGLDSRFAAYVGIVGGEPVASSLIFFGAEAAGVYFVSTVPELRRQGLGSAITAAALAEARRRGYGAAVLHATEMGYPVYRRLGFEEVCAVDMRIRLHQP